MLIYRLYKNSFILNNKFYNYLDKCKKKIINNFIIIKLITEKSITFLI